MNIHKIGYKLLKDDDDFYLCLLEATGNIIGNDIKYRTDEVYIYEIRRISNMKKVRNVNHICFYDNSIIKYCENEYFRSNLNISNEICAEGIHYFPVTGSFPTHFSIYFRGYNLNLENVSRIFNIWIEEVIFNKIKIKKEDLSKKLL